MHLAVRLVAVRCCSPLQLRRQVVTFFFAYCSIALAVRYYWHWLQQQLAVVVVVVGRHYYWSCCSRFACFRC